MKHLIVSSKKKMLIVFEEIMIRLIFVLQRSHQQDYWGNKPKRLIISPEKNDAPHYFFRKKWGASSRLQKKIKPAITSSEKKWSTSLFLQKKTKCLFISSENMKRLIISSEKKHFLKKYWGTWLLPEEIMRHLNFVLENNEALHFSYVEIMRWLGLLLQITSAVNKSSTSLFLQKKIKHLTIS